MKRLWKAAMGGLPADEGAWEWRYFVQTAVPSSDLAGKREDVYFPASCAAGLKLRNGTGSLEVKLRTGTLEIASRGVAERWTKRLHRSCTKLGSAGPSLELERLSMETGWTAEQLLGEGSSSPGTLRVHCQKDRKHMSHGEVTRCIFLVYQEGRTAPVLAESWQSVSVEISDIARLKCEVQKTALPHGAIVTGYPGIIAQIARRAEALLRTASSKGQSDLFADSKLCATSSSSSGAALVLPWRPGTALVLLWRSGLLWCFCGAAAKMLLRC
eukprot:TRINITY_DN12915_c0_g1_i2.p1 TRINITY_DN12915_c0_g1~~TRINITY_DN12915_c0_g1_i2.p1  ORF type:complete len:271 (+),score=44.04 TRINITY_DN12915_c0_g1_i2:106-918(+)